jgi:hypothetical protein
MGVHVDEARGQHKAIGIDYLAASGVDPTGTLDR